jgi:DNA-binding beta-propeller fold protein YncE
MRVRGCDGAHGLLVDAGRRLAFVACERNSRLVVVDLARRRILESHRVGDLPDVLAFDPGLRRLYVASESGVVAVFGVQRRGLRKLAQGFLADRAHSVAVDPATHLVYFPLEDVAGQPVLRVMRPAGSS